MNLKVRTVYLKELRDMLRDRRTIFATIAIPVLLYPLMTIALSEVSQLAMAKLNRETFPIAVLPGTRDIVARIHKSALETPEPIKGLEIKEKLEPEPPQPKSEREIGKKDRFATTKFDFQEMSAEAATSSLANGSVRAILTVSTEFERDLAAGKRPAIKLDYDRAERVSQSAYGRLTMMLERYESAVLKENLIKSKLTGDFLHPFIVEEQNIARAEKLGGSIFGAILPLLFIIMLMMGAMYPAIDLTAGEKERSTLETLVGSPARPLEIISGKFLAVGTLALINATINLGSCVISIKSLPLGNLGISFPWSVVPITLLLLPLAMFFSALLLMVSCFAANIKEAQIFCMPVFLTPIVGLALGMIPGVELEGPLLLVPVVNTAMLIKELFLGHGTLQQIGFVFFSTCLYSAGMVALAARVFAREEVLFSAQGSLRMFLSRRFFKPSLTPKPGDALLAAGILFPIYFNFQQYVQKVFAEPGKLLSLNALVISVLGTMYGLFLGVPVLLAKYLKANTKNTFLWTMPRFRSLAGAGLMGMSSWIIADQIVAIQSRFWRFEQMGLEDAIKPLLSSTGGYIALIFLFAVSPAICEEMFFRGFYQQGLLGTGERRRKHKWSMIILVGVTFGLYHLPVFRQPVTALMGIALAWTAYESRSIFPGMLTHFLNNALVFFGPSLVNAFAEFWNEKVALFGLKLVQFSEQPPAPGEPMRDMPLIYLLTALAMFGSGIFLIRNREK